MSNFSMRAFIKRGLVSSVGKLAEYQIIRQASEWMDKGVLQLSDLEEIQNALEAQKPKSEVGPQAYSVSEGADGNGETVRNGETRL